MAGGLATLGDLVFRINPSDINWNYQINTNVEETVGGRVIQVIGSTLSNLTIKGYYGQDRSRGAEGESHELADAFVEHVRALMDLQNATATTPEKMAPTQVFTYAPYGWKFDVYIISIGDESGGPITHKTGDFSYQYTISLFIVQDGSADTVFPGSTNGAIDKTSSGAVKSYIDRISNGFGWKLTGFNDPDILKDITGKKLTVTPADFDKMGFYKRNQVTFAAPPSGGGGGTTTTSPTGPAAPAGPIGAMFQDSSAMACPAGTRDCGVQDGYHAGTKIKIKVCAIPGFKSTSSDSSSISGANGEVLVNARYAANILAMFTAAKASGLTMSAGSSFRSMAHQTSLFNAPHSAPVATPGTSNHQMGLAIDYANCDKGSTTYKWLTANGSKYTVINFPKESWHWSATGG